MTDLTIVKVLKPHFDHFNPFIYEMPVAGAHIIVYQALNNIFRHYGQVFAGKVDEVVQLGVETGLEERDLRQGFEDLVRFGFLTIRQGVFTPTAQYLDKFLVTPNQTQPQPRFFRRILDQVKGILNFEILMWTPLYEFVGMIVGGLMMTIGLISAMCNGLTVIGVPEANYSPVYYSFGAFLLGAVIVWITQEIRLRQL